MTDETAAYVPPDAAAPTRRYLVHLYFDGPRFHDDTVVTVVAAGEVDALREALVAVGVPKVGGIELAP